MHSTCAGADLVRQVGRTYERGRWLEDVGGDCWCHAGGLHGFHVVFTDIKK